MRENKGKTVADLFPQLFDDDDEYEDTPQISEEDIADLQSLMSELNSQNESAPQ